MLSVVCREIQCSCLIRCGKPMEPDTFGTMNSQNQAARLALHVLLAGGFFLVPFLFNPRELNRLSHVFTNAVDALHFTGYFVVLAFLYVNYYFLLPRIFARKQYVWYALIAGGWVAIALAIPFLGEIILHPPHSHFEHEMPKGMRPPKPPVSLLVKHNLIFFAMAWFGSMFRWSRKQQFALEKEKAEAEAAFLRTQMNPHFMFNSLNSLYGLALREKAATTADSVLMLSDMMRFLLSEAPQDEVSLENEVTFLTNYIRFQRLRLPQTTTVDLQIIGNPGSLKITPMLLLPFVENAFKHGVDTERESDITLKIEISDGQLTLETSNHKTETGPADREKSGYGLDSTLRRLQLQYPGRHYIEIHDTPMRFAVQLRIDLK